MRTMNSNNFAHVLGSVLIGITLAGCGAQSDEAANVPPPPPEVDVARVQAEDVVLWGSFTGRVAAPETVEVRPRVSGYIEGIGFDEGQLVQEGDILFVIDQRPYLAREQLAAAELERAQSQLELASSEAERAQKLWQSRAISDEELDRRNAALIAARAVVNAASATLKTARLDLEYTQIKSPITGRIGRAHLTKGNLATADTSLLTTVVSVDPVYVYFESDQQTAQINPHDAQAEVPVRVRLASEREHMMGKLDFIDNRYDSRTGTLQYRAVVPNPDGRLRPGQFARVDMPVAGASQTVLVDQKAVLTDQDKRYVYVLDAQDKATKRFVDTGRRFDGLLVIRQGLQPGDRVVVNGLQKIVFPGMQVAPQLVDMRGTQELPVLASNTATE